MAASRTITAAVVRSLATVDSTVTVPQLRVLVMLSVAGLMNLSAVAERLGVNASNASRTCERLVQAGLVHRSPGSEDRRQVELTLSARGRRVVDDVMRTRQELLAAVVERMSPWKRAVLTDALEAFNAAATELEHDAHPDAADDLVVWMT
ncbi:MarR family transcriptional regulator [Nocardioides panacis]|jgi:DNA-binding MarR family transcriptional regulator|uniref:MarR family transcriptional regulator n=1 Tax=Nocardioides panacis TaxID=2849501 RepID=A0A975Y1P0_9ACTN|nr:MarR family transcriptional regulator [Nocardioides panacis]QWZ09711.1 MarR family transcriptional regulator [Nocardioides panacis]